MLTHQFRLYPDKNQQDTLWLHANKLNFVYNYFLNQRIENYKLGIKTNRKHQQAELVELKEKDPILAEMHSQVLQQVPLRLHKAFHDFFKRLKEGRVEKGKAGHPKFRSCRDFFGICYPQGGFKLQDNHLITKVYGDIPFVKHREITGEIKQIYISCKNNQFFLNVITDAVKTNGTPSGSIGIDIGLKWLIVAVDEEGKVVEKIRNRTDSKYFDKQIANLQQRMSKLKKGSRQYRFLRRVVNRLYGAKVRKINDFQHKVSKRLSSKYDTIYAENLSVKSMTESNYTNLNRSIRNAKLSQILTFFGYKANHLVLSNPKNTSKTCHDCGKIHYDLKLSDRTITCSCGSVYDRDENAARNVFCLGQAIQKYPEYIESLTIQEALTFR